MKTENGTHPSAAEQFYSMVMLAVLVISGLLIKMALSRQNPSVFRGVCAFFIGQPKHICQPRILPLPP